MIDNQPLAKRPISRTTTASNASMFQGGTTIKSASDIAAMRQAGKVTGLMLKTLMAEVKQGMTTKKMDEIAYDVINSNGAKTAFKGYNGFTGHICTSINEEIVHGIPSEKRVVKEGDLLKLDAGCVVDGFYGDSAVSIWVGDVPQRSKDLVNTTRESLEAGIKAARPGARLGDIGFAVQSLAESRGFSVVREYVGHGIGRSLHEDPQVQNFGMPGTGPLLQPGMVIAIEPMLNMGGWQTKILKDNWTVVTADGSLSCHFEHTVYISPTGPEVLTVR